MSNVWPWHVRGFDSRHSHGMHPKYEKQNCWLHHHYWFVVCLPLWKIWLRQLGLFFPTEWKNKKCSKPPTRLYPVVFCYRKKQNTFWWLNTSFPCANLFGHPPPLIPMAHESYACMYVYMSVCIYWFTYFFMYISPSKIPIISQSYSHLGWFHQGLSPPAVLLERPGWHDLPRGRPPTSSSFRSSRPQRGWNSRWCAPFSIAKLLQITRSSMVYGCLW